jgi:hypothetical protein
LGTWNYNLREKPREQLGRWQRYELAYTIPHGVYFVDVKIEDGKSYLPDDPRGAGVGFDDIELVLVW